MMIAAALLMASCHNVPSDAKLIATFEDNRAAFEHVRDIVLRADGLERIEKVTVQTLPLLPTSQRDDIARLMDKSGVNLITVLNSPKGEQAVNFNVHSSGLSIGGTSKGIEWSNRRDKIRPLLDSLDDPSDRRGYVTETWFDARRPLKDGWYLYLSKD
jgi:hypothetical protein